MSEYCTSADLAKLFEITARRVQQLTQDGILIKSKVKIEGKTLQKYDKDENVKNYIRFIKESQKEKDIDINKLEKEKLKAEVKMKKAKAEMAKKALDEFEGKLHSAEDVEDMTTDLVMAIRAALLSLPGQMAVELVNMDDASQISEFIKISVNDILEELSAYEYNPDEYQKRIREREGWNIDEDE